MDNRFLRLIFRILWSSAFSRTVFEKEHLGFQKFIFLKHFKANLQLGGLEKEKCFLKIMEGTRYKLFIQTGTTIGAGTDSVGKIFNGVYNLITPEQMTWTATAMQCSTVAHCSSVIQTNKLFSWNANHRWNWKWSCKDFILEIEQIWNWLDVRSLLFKNFSESIIIYCP